MILNSIIQLNPILVTNYLFTNINMYFLNTPSRLIRIIQITMQHQALRAFPVYLSDLS